MAANNSIRIIGGLHRGRKLPVPDIEGLRPTQSRVRETLFNWLVSDLTGASVVDLFSGTGALGFEALSRGASQVQFVEKSPLAAKGIQQNIRLLKSTNGKVTQTDAIKWLSSQPEQSVDLIFLDPPFGHNFIETILGQDSFYRILKPEARVYIECETAVSFNTSLVQLKEKSTKTLRYSLWQWPG